MNSVNITQFYFLSYVCENIKISLAITQMLYLWRLFLSGRRFRLAANYTESINGSEGASNLLIKIGSKLNPTSSTIDECYKLSTIVHGSLKRINFPWIVKHRAATGLAVKFN